MAEQGRLARLQSVLLIELFCSKFTSNHNVTKLGSTRESSLCHRKEKGKKSPREELSKHLFSKSVGLLSFYLQKSSPRITRFQLLLQVVEFLSTEIKSLHYVVSTTAAVSTTVVPTYAVTKLGSTRESSLCH